MSGCADHGVEDSHERSNCYKIMLEKTGSDVAAWLGFDLAELEGQCGVNAIRQFRTPTINQSRIRFTEMRKALYAQKFLRCERAGYRAWISHGTS
jgi:hypothetical protein